MLPKLAAYYQEQLDLADAAVRDTQDPKVKAFAEKLQRESERALGVINEDARSMGILIKPHVRVSLAEKLRQSGRLRQTPDRSPAPEAKDASSDLEFLREVMANIQEIRPQFATYKENSRREMHDDLARLFDDELVPNYEEAKGHHDRVRNVTR
jgi:hypothetical protein